MEIFLFIHVIFFWGGVLSVDIIKLPGGFTIVN